MKKIIPFLMIIICMVSFTACSGGNNNSQPEEPEEVITVSTPYADICVPKSFEGNVESTVVSEDPYILSFSAMDGTELFALYFGQETENLVGTLKLADKNIVIYATNEELDSESDNYQTYCGYQEGINTIISHLVSDYDFVVNEIVDFEDDSTFDIETKLATLKYPNKWKEKVQIEVTDEKVSFSNDGVQLFDLVFKESDGYLLGTYSGTPIYLVSYTVKNDEQGMMQEDVNIILQYLLEDDNFTINVN